MELNWVYLVWAVGALLAAPLVLGTPLVKSTHWIAKRAKITRLKAGDAPAIESWLDEQRPAFEALGFQFVGNGLLADFTPNVTTYFSLFRHVESGLAGTATWMESPQKNISYLEISQLFDDGTSLNVNNSPVSLTWRLPDKFFYRFPWQTDLKRLFQLHQFIRQGELKQKVGKRVEMGKEFDVVAQFTYEEGQKMQKLGAYQIGSDSTRLVLTWSGAVNAVWANTFPGKQIFAFQELGLSRRIEKTWLKKEN